MGSQEVEWVEESGEELEEARLPPLSPRGGTDEVGSTGTPPCSGAVGGAVRGERTRQGRGIGPTRWGGLKPGGQKGGGFSLFLYPFFCSFLYLQKNVMQYLSFQKEF